MTRASLLLGLAAAVGVSSVAADMHTERQIISDAYMVENARAAMDEIMARDDAAEEVDQAAFMSGDFSLEDFVSSQPMFQGVYWPAGPCVDLVSLYPSPPDGWAIASDWGRSENPIGEDRAELFYVRIPDLPLDDPGFVAAQQSVVVRVTANPAQAQLWNMQMDNDQMRDLGFDDGPFGYPLMKYQTATMLGDFFVDVSGTGTGHAEAFLETIIGCAIDSGLIAHGVDPSTLTR